jgi:aldehyde dehydrogenase (NAD+)
MITHWSAGDEEAGGKVWTRIPVAAVLAGLLVVGVAAGRRRPGDPRRRRGGQNAAPTVKRVRPGAGRQSANIILDDADLEAVVTRDTTLMCNNSGQSCNAPSRMLVPASLMEEAAPIATAAAESVVVGDPSAESTRIGPHVMEPVMVMIGYEDDDDAVRIADDTTDGLSGYISGDDARAMARRIRSGNVHLNGAAGDLNAPFGGSKQSGNGRAWGELGMEEFLETKAILGYGA